MGRGFLDWVRLRIQEPSTWAGVAMIAIAFGSDAARAERLVEAVSLIVGGGLVATRPGRWLRRDEAASGAADGIGKDDGGC